MSQLENSVISNSKAAKAWAAHCLTNKGYKLDAPSPEVIVNTPWSHIGKFKTSEGYFYLKQTPPKIALEATIIQILKNKFNANVPKIIAHNSKLNCFLITDAGLTLRENLKQKFDTDLIFSSIKQFTSLQLSVSQNISPLLDIGVPDWRLEKFPSLLKEIITQENLLIEEGLSEVELQQLHEIVPKLSNLCSKLLDYPLQQSFV